MRVTVSGAPTESALLVPVVEAEDVVSSWRARLDPAARRGVPAHVTLLYPFAFPTAINDDIRTRLREVFSTVRPFDFSLASVRWFGDNVVFLAPEPDESFRRLTNTLTETFPEYPPYAGAFVDVVPHLTVGDNSPPALLHAAADDVRPKLPIRSHAREVWLLIGSDAPASWNIRDRFPLSLTT